jgi:transcriptional regulator of acetoin/glycerol metabolism
MKAGRGHFYDTDGTLRTYDDVYRDYLSTALLDNDWNVGRTAKTTGISAATIYRRIKTYGLTNPSD